MKKVFSFMSLFCGFTIGSYAQPGATLRFDGSNDQVAIGHFARPVNMTIEAWIKTNSTSAAMQIIGWAGNTGQSAEFKLNSGSIGYCEWDGTSFPCTSGALVNDNAWHHVAVVRTSAGSNNVSIYVDGVLNSIGTSTLAPVTNALNIGTYNYFNTQQFFNGYIDELRIWNRSLTLDEIQNNMNCELPSGQIGLVRYYNFNMGVAGGNNSSVGNLPDLSGNSGNGTLVNFALNGATSNWTAPGAVTSGNNCSMFTGIKEGEADEGLLQIYPNPCTVNAILRADHPLENVTLKVINSLGQEVKEMKNISGQTVTILSEDLSCGIYFIRLTKDNKVFATRKLVVADK